MAGWPGQITQLLEKDGRLLIVVILCANNDVKLVHGGSWSVYRRLRACSANACRRLP